MYVRKLLAVKNGCFDTNDGNIEIAFHKNFQIMISMITG